MSAQRPLVLAAVLMLAPSFAIAQAPAPTAGTAQPAAQAPGWTLGSPTAGQPGERGDGGRQYEIDAKPRLALRAIPAAKVDRRALARVRLEPITGIDERRFGFARIDAYVQRTHVPEDERSAIESLAKLQLTIATRTSRGSVRWWRLRPDDLPILDEPVGLKARSFGGLASLPERVVPATPDGRVPIVDVQFSSETGGNTSGAEVRHHLLLDLRAVEPKVLGVFEEAAGWCGGACGHSDCLYGLDDETGCRWDAALDDFVCATTRRRYDTFWATRRATRTFRFSTGATVSLLRQTGESTLPGLGRLDVVVDVKIGDRAVVLLAAPPLSWNFGVRFFTAPVRAPQPDQLAEVGSRLDARTEMRSLHSHKIRDVEGEELEPDPRSDAFAGYTPDGLPASVRSEVVVQAGTLTVLRVVVAEGESKGVYLVGFEAMPDRLVTDAMLVATDGESYLACGEWRVFATAVSMSLTSAPFAAVLDIEPSATRDRVDSPYVDPPPVQCPVRATVNWQAGEGFTYVSREKQCAPTRQQRWVVIADDGSLSVAADRPRPEL
jgi:hypothetical protein